MATFRPGSPRPRAGDPNRHFVARVASFAIQLFGNGRKGRRPLLWSRHGCRARRSASCSRRLRRSARRRRCASARLAAAVRSSRFGRGERGPTDSSCRPEGIGRTRVTGASAGPEDPRATSSPVGDAALRTRGVSRPSRAAARSTPTDRIPMGRERATTIPGFPCFVEWMTSCVQRSRPPGGQRAGPEGRVDDDAVVGYSLWYDKNNTTSMSLSRGN